MLKKISGVVVAVSAFAATSAHATLPAGVTTGFTEFGTDATTLAGLAATAVMLVLGYSIGLKLTKRFANKV